MDESDTESDIEEDEDIENPEPKEEDSDVDLLIAPNDLVITGSADATAKVWSVYSGECIHVSIKSQIWYLLFSKPCSKCLASLASIPVTSTGLSVIISQLRTLPLRALPSTSQ